MENSPFSAAVSTRENFFYFFINKQKWFRTFLPYTKKELLDLEEERTTGSNLTGSGPTCLLHEAQHLDINPRDPNPGNHGLVVFKNFPISRERKQKLKELAATTKKEAIAKLAQKDSTGSFSLFQDIDNFVKYYTMDWGKYYFEVVFAQNHQKPRFDVDISFADFAPYLTELELSDKKTVMTLMDFECQKVLDILIRAIYKLIPGLNISRDIIVCTSHSNPEEQMDSQKRSLHIIVNNYFHENNQEAQMFFEDTISSIPEILRFIVRWVDHSVYKSMQQFRILGSTKVKKNRTKIFCEDFLFENEIIHHIYSDRALLKNSGSGFDLGLGSGSGIVNSSIPNFFLPSRADLETISLPEDKERMIKKKFIVQLRESLLTETHNCTHLVWERPGITDNGEKVLSIDAILKIRRGVYGSEERSGSPSAAEGEEEFYFENHELEKKHAKKAFAMLEKMMGIGYKERAFPYEYNRREKGMVLMKRIRPSLCRICKAVHDNEHPYIFFVKNHQEPTLTELRQFYEDYFSQENKTKKYSPENELDPVDLVDDLIIDENDANEVGSRADKMAFSIMFDCRRSFSHLGYEKKLFLGYMSEDASIAILSCLLSPMMNSLDRRLEKEKMKKPLKINELLENSSDSQQRNIDYFAAPLISNHIKQSSSVSEVIVVNIPKTEQIVSAEVTYEKKKNKELWEELIIETNLPKKKKNKIIIMPALSSPPIMINNTSNLDRNLLTRRTESMSSFQFDSNRNNSNFIIVPKSQRRTDFDLLRNPRR